MATTSLVRVLLSRWHATAAGLLLSLVLAALTSSYFPVQYSSSGTVVLLAPKVRGSNPMLDFGPSVTTTALVVVQALGSPEIAAELGLPAGSSSILDSGQDSYTVKNIGSSDLRDNGVDRPFITVTAQSLTPGRSEAIVAQVLDAAQRQLRDRQISMHVPKARAIDIQAVVDPTPPKLVLTRTLKAVGIALVLGLSITIGMACLLEKKTRRLNIDVRSVLSNVEPASASDTQKDGETPTQVQSLGNPAREVIPLAEARFF